MSDAPDKAFSLMAEGDPRAFKFNEDYHFLERSDWVSCGITVTFALTVYWFTLAPEVTLVWSGVNATAAMYGGVGAPPGYPLWTLYAWLFIKLLPFSNVAWRIALSSAVAGALACGVIALIVSRGSAMILEQMDHFNRLSAIPERWLRVVCGFTAGTAFAFHRVFWGEAIVVESTALAMLLFSLVLYLLLRWVYVPEQTCYLYASFFIYGLMLTVHLSLAAAVPGLLFLVLFRNPPLGRDLSFTLSAIVGAVLLIRSSNVQFDPLRSVYLIIAIAAAMVCLVLVIITRRLLTHWKTVSIAGLFLCFGLSLYLYLPLASMTNPPVNWGYSRTVEGFFHTLSRGQYERLHPTASLGQFASQVLQFAEETVQDLGLIFLIPALFPFFLLHRIPNPERGWLLGLLTTFLCQSLLTLAMLNPPPDQPNLAFCAPYFIASHLVLAVSAGYGLAWLGTRIGRARPKPGNLDYEPG